MKKYLIILISFLFFTIRLTGDCKAESLTLCNDWDELKINEYILSNNVWNKKEITNYKQCIFKANDTLPFGWTWDWPDGINYDVKSYPEIIYGWKPFHESSSNTLPKQISNINYLTVSYNISISADGRYNTAFDLWIINSPVSHQDNRTKEIMIWIDKKGIEFNDSFVEKISIDGENYDFYFRKANSNYWNMNWDYIAFVKEYPKLDGTLDIYKFLNYLSNKNYILPNEYLACVEIGNEIVDGKGETKINNYSIQVNSKSGGEGLFVSSANPTGITYNFSEIGDYKFVIKGGANAPCVCRDDSDCKGWHSKVYGYMNRKIDWQPSDYGYFPSNPDIEIGSWEHLNDYIVAERNAIDMESQTITVNSKGEYVTFVIPDCTDNCYSDNAGGIFLELKRISNPLVKGDFNSNGKLDLEDCIGILQTLTGIK